MSEVTTGTARHGSLAPSPPFGDNSIDAEPLWYEFGAGRDEPSVPPWAGIAEPPMSSHTAPPPPASVLGGRRTELPRGTAELLGTVPFPHGRASVPDPDEALARALVTSFGVQWSDPDNPYNPHRGYASPRCLYPVQVFVDDGEGWHMLEPERHSLTALTSGGHRGRRRRIALTGRYTRVPRAYKWFRGSLVNLELGITLRSLALGLELFGLPGRLVLPHEGSAGLLDELGLTPGWEWSLPLVIELAPRGTAEPIGPSRRPGVPEQRSEDAVPREHPDDAVLRERPDDAVLTEHPDDAVLTERPDDAVLRDVVRVNRAQAFSGPPAPVTPAVPDRSPSAPGPRPDGPPVALSWPELMWRRNSGRMPRGLLGMSGRRTRMPAASVRDAIRWLEAPPPGRTLRAVSELLTLTAVIQDVEGFEDGVHRVRDGEAVLLCADRTAAARLEAEYGYGLAVDSGCDIRNASAIWFWSVRPRELFARFGPGGWSAAQYCCGWALHGLCLSATAYGMFARPVRAFNEAPTQRVLRLDPDEMVALAAVAGAPRHAAPSLLDLRV